MTAFFEMLGLPLMVSLAMLAMLMVLIFMARLHVLLQLTTGVAVYLTALFAFRSFNDEETAMIRRAAAGLIPPRGRK